MSAQLRVVRKTDTSLLLRPMGARSDEYDQELSFEDVKAGLILINPEKQLYCWNKAQQTKIDEIQKLINDLMPIMFQLRVQQSNPNLGEGGNYLTNLSVLSHTVAKLQELLGPETTPAQVLNLIKKAQDQQMRALLGGGVGFGGVHKPRMTKAQWRQSQENSKKIKDHEVQMSKERLEEKEAGTLGAMLRAKGQL